MPETVLTPENNIVRYCRPGALSRDKTRAIGEAFRLKKEKDEKGLSVYCLDLIARHTIAEKIREIIETTVYSYSSNGKFAEVNVGELVEKVMREFSIELKVLNDKIKHDAHCLICGLSYDDFHIFEYIAEELGSKLHPVN